jgi:kynurenine formamidase
MRPIPSSVILGAALFVLAPSGKAQTWRFPPDAERCPSRWGASDERGSANHMGPRSVLRARELIQTGEVIELAHVLDRDMPFFGTRRFDLHTKRTLMNPGANHRGSNEEIVVSEIGQVGTQFDGFAHQSHEDRWYNCFPVSENATRSGFAKLGIEKVGMLMTRGVLVDIAALKAVEVLPDGYQITKGDIEAALARQNLSLAPGDAVILHTGWGKLWGKDNPRYVKSCPGIGIEAAEWLAAQDPMLIGSDNWPVEIAPNPDPELSLPVHQIALVVHGIHLLENMKLDELAAKKVYQFAFVLQPLKIGGGTGSTVSPVAIR